MLERGLGVHCLVSHDLDTDRFGTFSGEIPRQDDPLQTARNKCEAAMELSGCDLAIASEGSFGVHPVAGFIPCDDELLLFIDRKNNLEIAVRELSTETNFGSATVATEGELIEFARKAGFPEHGLILRHAADNTDLVKGITDFRTLLPVFRTYLDKAGAVTVETDMRAMFNPIRMQVIERAAARLVGKITSVCPTCSTPGFGVTEAVPGLPCGVCSSPTRSTLAYRYACTICGFSELQDYPHAKTSEDPAFCDRCNP